MCEIRETAISNHLCQVQSGRRYLSIFSNNTARVNWARVTSRSVMWEFPVNEGIHPSGTGNSYGNGCRYKGKIRGGREVGTGNKHCEALSVENAYWNEKNVCEAAGGKINMLMKIY